MTIIKPGNFGKNVPADNRRGDFDFGNEQVLYLKRSVDILFIGDSITQLWGHYAYFGTKCYIVNRGIGGVKIFKVSFSFKVQLTAITSLSVL